MRQLQTNSVPALAAGTVLAIGTAVLAGWRLGFEPFMTILPGLIRMKPNTAAAFVFAAMGLLLASNRKHHRLQATCASVVGLVGAITLIEYMYGGNFHIDQLLFRDPVQLQFPGRMAHITAANFLLTGVMLYPFRSRTGERVTDAVALLVCFGSTFAIVGYLYGVPLLYGSIRYTAMAIHTGFGFLALSLGFLYIRRVDGLVQIFHAETAGGTVARRLVPLAILIPICVGAVFIRFNFGEVKLAFAFVVVCDVLLVVASILRLARALDKSEAERGMAQRASETDALTGIYNRRYFDHRLLQEIHRCMWYSRSSCLILFDIDRFKNLNDRFGHQSGDEVLEGIAQACARSLRAADIMCRYGGEEFAIIVPETTGEDAMRLAHKIRALIAGLRFHKVPIQVTVSLGVAQLGHTLTSSEDAIAAADKALYAAKKLGRNCECLYGGIGIPELDSIAPSIQ
jgi:diguanylate cyclase (GGDEF)-like protein